MSIIILNDIRSASRPFLETEGPEKTGGLMSETFDEAFPSFGSAKTAGEGGKTNTLVGRRKSDKSQKAKRRVRPVTVTTTTTSSVWGQGNLANLATSAEPSNHPFGRQTTAVLSTPTKHVRKTKISPIPDTFVIPTDDKADKKPPDTPLESVDELNRLVEIYCTLILNSLVPSTTLEIHLLFRALAAPDSTSPGTTEGFGLILSTRQRLEYFARNSLVRVSECLICLGQPLLSRISQCKVLQQKVPLMIDKINTYLSSVAHIPFEPPEEISTTPQLTIPFDEEQDSRHLYKTREELALYKNREECRDAFMHQLRAFLNIRGKLMDSVQSEKATQKIRKASQIVVNGVYDVNWVWFANFFCDLLIQLGSVPMQETDKEILKIADKDKLQKLHSRFSSKSSTQGKSSKKLSTGSSSTSSSPFSEAQQLFTGHQEFFYVFITAADSHTFNTFLRSVLIERVLDRNSSGSLTARSILDSVMLARFLGLLQFACHWRAFRTIHERPSSYILDPLVELKDCGVPVKDLILRAASDGRLVSTIPWTSELLRMSAWTAETIKKSAEFTETVGLLRSVLVSVADHKTISYCVKGILRGALESLFDQSLRSPWSPRPTGSEMKVQEAKAMNTPDSKESGFVLSLIPVLDPNVDELSSLIQKLSKSGPDSLRSPGVSRKLRPSFVSPNSSADKLKEQRENSTISLIGNVPGDDSGSVQSKLADSFFHNHADVRQIAEFTVERILRKEIQNVLACVVQPETTKEVCDGGILSRSKLLDLSEAFLSDRVSSKLRLILPCLCDHEEQVINTACILTTKRAVLSARNKLSWLIEKELASVKSVFSNGEQTSRKLFEETAPQNTLTLRPLISSVGGVCQAFDSSENVSFRLQKMNLIQADMDSFLQSMSYKIPPENEVREFVTTVLRLDKHTDDLVRPLISNPCSLSKEDVHLAIALFRLSCSFNEISACGLPSAESHAADPSFMKGLRACATAKDLKSEFDLLWEKCYQARLVSKMP